MCLRLLICLVKRRVTSLWRSLASDKHAASEHFSCCRAVHNYAIRSTREADIGEACSCKRCEVLDGWVNDHGIDVRKEHKF